jgi:deoxyribodipyrimidine photo-lyase
MWFRDDLRIEDNPALTQACREGAVLCLYILDDSPARRAMGAASRWWLAQSLRALQQDLARIGGALVLMKGDPAKILPDLVTDAGISAVFWNRRYGAAEIALDSQLKAQLTTLGATASSTNGHLLNEPWTVTTKTGTPCKVFTPYWRAAREKGEPPAPLPAPDKIMAAPLPAAWAERFLSIAALKLEPTRPDWSGGMREAWQPGTSGAKANLARFLEEGLAGYGENRNRPDMRATSRLSQVWHITQAARLSGTSRAPDDDFAKFCSELGWREFSHHLLFHNPELARKNYNPRFDAFPWDTNAEALAAWQRGQTGYPIVDAGMRELWTTGWMHNRVRMIVGSFLVKHLLLDWRLGEDWFWDTLVDADPANNAASWQWIAGSGADAAPYFRIFNPMTQGEKFDPKGAYVARWVPELAKLPVKFMHQPWTAPQGLLLAAGVTLGQSYPHPIVEHDKARQRAFSAFKALKPDDDLARSEV